MLKNLSLLFVFTLILPFNTLAEDSRENIFEFDHLATAFPLEGLHQFVECDACHVSGFFKGIPKTCSGCHDARGLFSSSSKALSHIPTRAECSECHTETSWNVVVQVHSSRAFGRCTDCHNGKLAATKSATHVQTALQCDGCHGMEDWEIRRLDHSLVFGSCESCHNGVIAATKPALHISAINDCDLCHVNNTWSTSVVDHSAVIGVCSSCHNGTVTTGKQAGHIPASEECDSCHFTLAWTPAKFDHSNVSGSCSSCHNGVIATGQGTSHFMTTRECDTCHVTSSWDVDSYSHSSPNYPDHGKTFSCISCHIANAESPAWKNSTFAPDCAACHESQFQPAFHQKTQNPVTLYSASELRNCAGACHIYTDDTLNVIAISRSGEHSFGSF